MLQSDSDPYLWLEEIEGERALGWVRRQNALALSQLEGDPRFAGLHADALALANNGDRLPLGTVRDGFLYNFWQDETHVRGLWRRSPLDAYARNAPIWETLLDIDALAATENANWVYAGVECRDGAARCMVALSDGGRDAAVWREFDLAARTFVSDGFSLPEAKTSLAWADDDTLLVSTDWGEGSLTASGYPFIVKRWRRGQALGEAQEILRGDPSDVGVFTAAFADVDGSRVLLAVQAASFFESIHWRLDGAGPQRINLPPKATIQGVHKGFLVFTLEEAWRGLPQGALAAYPLEDIAAEAPRAAALSVPGPRDSIEAVAFTREALLVAGYRNVRGRILRLGFDGRAWIETELELPPNGAVTIAGASPTEGVAFAVFEDFLTPSTLFAIEERVTRMRPVRSLAALFESARFVTEQFEAVSRDGTQIPYFVVRPRDRKADGRNPTLLYAYGGFQVSQTPAYLQNAGKLWLERGGTYVLASIRGGGEFGPAWHQAGLGARRQLIFDDFYAVQQDLIQREITSPRRLGIMGGSNGGLLMGVMLNQHPEMINAAIVQVPLLDMLRYDQLLAGASWVDEYGSPADPAQRRFLEQMSPYHNLRPRADFPLPFVLTSTKDDRVHPGHARKYVARLRELGLPVLYYENIDGGHSAAANLNEAARRRALEYTYLAQRLID
jgi:prolyl oligopeptidase